MQKLIILFSLLGSLAILWTSCEKDPTTTQDDGTCSTITDSRDGETYTVIKIGDQCWMAESLRYNAPNSKVYSNIPDSQYGRLYDWNTVMGGATSSSSNPSGIKGICPEGWHLPSDAEWTVLENSIGGNGIGLAMKSTTGWSNNGNGTNSSGFNVFPGGQADATSYFSLGDNTAFWTSTLENGANGPWARAFDATSDDISRGIVYGTDSHEYCRCVKD